MSSLPEMQGAAPLRTAPIEFTQGQHTRSLAKSKHESLDVETALPHALGTEKAVLSVMLREPDDFADQPQLTADHFYLPAHRVILATMRQLTADGKPIELTTFFQHLADTGKIDDIGGPATLTEIMCYAPNTAHFNHHMEELNDKLYQRLSILAGRALVNLDEAEHDRLIAQRLAVMQESSGGMADIISARAFDVSNPPADPPPMVRLGTHGIFTAGNLSAIIADRKAGKSSCVAALMAAIIAPPHSQGDFLGLTAENPAGKAVVHFDTEQSPADHHALIMRALRRAGLSEPPAWFSSYQLTGLSLADRTRFVEAVCKREADQHGGLQAAIIDGIADLCRDPNDQAESFDLVEKWHNFSVNQSCVVLAVLHLNPGTEKSRGHLGSQLERKAETPLMIKKNSAGISTMFASHARKAHFPENEGFSFQWCDTAQMHVSITKDERNQARDEIKRNKAADEANRIMAGLPPMSYTELCQLIESESDVGTRTAKNRVKDWLESGIITKHENGNYSLPD